MVQIHVSPYIKKFADAEFGNPIKLQSKTSMHMVLRSLWFQTFQAELFTIHHSPFTSNHTPLTISIEPPKGYQPYGENIKQKSQVTNKLLTTLFFEKMHEYVTMHTDEHIKNNLENFCSKYKIELDEDITQDALVKMYYRYRVWLDKK